MQNTLQDRVRINLDIILLEPKQGVSNVLWLHFLCEKLLEFFKRGTQGHIMESLEVVPNRLKETFTDPSER